MLIVGFGMCWVQGSALPLATRPTQRWCHRSFFVPLSSLLLSSLLTFRSQLLTRWRFLGRAQSSHITAENIVSHSPRSKCGLPSDMMALVTSVDVRPRRIERSQSVQ